MFVEFTYLQAFIMMLISISIFGGLSLLLKSYLLDWLKGLSLNLFIFCFGIGLHVAQKDILKPNHFSKYKSEYLLLRIKEPLLERKKSYKALAEVISAFDSAGNQQTCIGKLAIYFQKDSNIFSNIHYGDILLIKSNYKEASPPQNPYEFNYKRYLAFNNIYHQSYLQDNDFIKTGKSDKNILFDFSYKAQDYFKEVLNKYVSSKTEVAVSQALLYGYDDDIDADLMKAYSNTGTLHVLAVSGMHVGIIFWIISKLLLFLDKKRSGQLIKAIISLVLLWAYSLLCGFSPSILRATVMFSFMIIGKLKKRDVNIYNTLATSAFVILVFDTNIIANVGFQLSYLAVLGIVTFQKRIYDWYTPTYWITDQIWTIIAVSIAAQVATFPVGFLYFHQFPFCFLFSNLIIIPLTTIILFLDIGLMVLSFWDWAASILGFITKWLIILTNKIVMLVEDLPYSYTNGIHISIAETILIYVLILYVFFWFIHIKHQYLTYALLLCLTISVYNGYESFANQTQKNITFYNIPKATAFNIIQNGTANFYADSVLINDEERFRFHVQQHIWSQGVDKVDKTTIQDSYIMQLTDRKLWINRGPLNLKDVSKNDIILLTQGTFVDFNDLSKSPEALFILSSDLSARKRQYFANKLKELNILFVDLNETGAYSIAL
jgi:competence protein ComEC